MDWLDRTIIEIGNVLEAIIYSFVAIVITTIIFKDKKENNK